MRSTTYGTVEPVCECQRTEPHGNNLRVPEPMPMNCDDLLGVAYELSTMTYLVLWPDVPVNRGVCRESLGRFNAFER